METAGTYDVAVVGGGIHGCTLALFLARGGMRVALVERGSLCREASGTNAGTLTMHMTRAALIPYALRGHDMWATAPDWLGHAVGVVVCPGLSLAFTEAEAEMLRLRADKRRGAGAPIEIVSSARARQVEPGLSEAPILAAHCEIDGFASAYLTGLAYRAALLDAGVEVMEHSPAVGIDRGDKGFAVLRSEGPPVRAKRLILTGGVWLEDMAAWLGLRLPIKVLVNQLAVTERLPPVMRTVLGISSGLLSLKQFENGTIVIGGGWQGIGDRERGGVSVLPESLIGNLRLACHAVPALRDARLVRAWVGLEAETADALPVAGAVPGVPDAYLCGSVHSGYTSGPYIARLPAERILGREGELPLFPIERLVGDRQAAAGLAQVS